MRAAAARGRGARERVRFRLLEVEEVGVSGSVHSVSDVQTQVGRREMERWMLGKDGQPEIRTVSPSLDSLGTHVIVSYHVRCP